MSCRRARKPAAAPHALTLGREAPHSWQGSVSRVSIRIACPRSSRAGVQQDPCVLAYRDYRSCSSPFSRTFQSVWTLLAQKPGSQ